MGLLPVARWRDAGFLLEILVERGEVVVAEVVGQRLDRGAVLWVELTPELEVYYNYTCQEGDYIKTCTVPSPKLDETDLEREKKMLKI